MELFNEKVEVDAVFNDAELFKNNEAKTEIGLIIT